MYSCRGEEDVTVSLCNPAPRPAAGKIQNPPGVLPDTLRADAAGDFVKYTGGSRMIEPFICTGAGGLMIFPC